METEKVISDLWAGIFKVLDFTQKFYPQGVAGVCIAALSYFAGERNLLLNKSALQQTMLDAREKLWTDKHAAIAEQLVTERIKAQLDLATCESRLQSRQDLIETQKEEIAFMNLFPAFRKSRIYRNR